MTRRRAAATVAGGIVAGWLLALAGTYITLVYLVGD